MHPRSSTVRALRHATLLTLAAALIGSGCFTSPNVDVSTIQCQVPDDCPSGYVCKFPGRPGGCCRPDDQTCGATVDASQSEAPVFALDGPSVDQGTVDQTAIDGRALDTPEDVRLGGMDGALDSADVPITAGNDATGLPDIPSGSDVGATEAPVAPVCQSAPDGTPCGDGMVCNKSQCVACAAEGSCTLGTPCHKGVWSCSTGTAVCVDGGNLPDGTDCSGGNVCRSGVCSTCVAGAACPLTGSPCHAGILTCLAGVSSCVDNGAKPETTPCDDGNACTKNDMCSGGTCVGTAYSCIAPDACHLAGTCNGDGSCSFANQPDGTTCNDGNPCTKSDKCTGGSCSGTSYTCAAPDQCHTAGTCNGDGTCSYGNQPSTTSCNDGDQCTYGDHCSVGTCIGTAYSCSAPDLCHYAGTCNGGGGCNPGAAVTCTYLGECAVTYCNPANGQCMVDWTAKNGTVCTSNPQPTCWTGICSAGSCEDDLSLGCG